MKKFTLPFSIVLFALITMHRISFAQAQRLVLVEEFTQASCPPCGQQNPAFNDLLNSNTGKVTSLKYQVWWPGIDPMNEDNPDQVTSRVNYYNVSYVPWGWMDGVSISDDCGYWDGAPVCLSQSDIDDASAMTSPFNLSVSYSVSGDQDSIYVTLNLEAVGAVSSNVKARIAVVEKVIDFGTPPGTNGEIIFENVMKKMLPTATGTLLPATMDIGYTKTITAAWKLANIYDFSQLGVIAFIQDDIDNTIYQSAFSGYPVGIANPATFSIHLYPNPANESAVVQMGTIVSDETKLEIVNVLGQVIYSKPAKSNVDLNINTSKFETGMYIYRLNDNGKMVAQDKFNVSH